MKLRIFKHNGKFVYQVTGDIRPNSHAIKTVLKFALGKVNDHHNYDLRS